MATWRVSAWTHPEDADGFKLREHSIVATKFEGSDQMGPRGRCTITVPETSDWRNLLAVQNPTAVTDTSLIRVFGEGIDNAGDPDQEYKLTRYKKKIEDDGTAVVELYGTAWKAGGVDAAVIRWWDWTAGATKTTQPDWEYGGANILTNGDLEENGTIPNVWELYNDGAASDTFTLTDGTDTTLPIAWDAGAGTIETRLETDITAISQVKVTGEGTEDEPWTIEFSDPKFGITLEETSTGMTSTLDETESGGLDPTGWMRAQTITRGVNVIFGEYASNDGFAPSTNFADTGTYSLRINPLLIGRRYAGAQQVLNVTPGATYQASIRIRPLSATDKYRFIIRSIDEDFIASDTGGTGGTSYSTGTFNTVTISDIVIPAGVTQIIYRFSNVDAVGVNPLPFYLDNARMARGQPASTITVIAADMLADAQTDHAPGLVRIPWLNAGAYTPTLDSSGAALPDESVILRRGFKYASGVFGGKFAELGYEYDVTPNGDTPEWDLELWAEGNRGAAITGAAFHVGLGVAGGLIAGRDLAATRWLGEGKDGLIVEAVDTAQETASGVVEAYFGDPDITSADTLLAKAQHKLDEDVANRVALTVELDDSAPVPYETVNVGDTVEFSYAGTMDKNDRRISEIILKAVTDDGGELVWTPSVTASKLFIGQGAINEAVYGLLTAYERLPDLAGGLVGEALRETGEGAPDGAFIRLSRNATQSIAVNGEPISWDTFGPVASGFSETLPSTTVTIVRPGYYNVAVQAGWSSWTNGGTVTVVRTRNGVPSTVWPSADDPGLWTASDGQLFEGTAHAIECLEGDTLQVDIDADDSSAQTLASATLAVYLVDRAEPVFYRELVLADGPLAYWRLGEASGTNAADEMGSFDQTYQNTPTLGVVGIMQDGFGDTAVDLVAASSEHVLGQDWSAMDFASGPFSIEAWFNADILSATTAVLIMKRNDVGVQGNENGWELSVVSAGVFFAEDSNTSIVSSGAVSNDTDYHVVVTFDGSTTLRLYLNGVLVDTDTGGISITANTVSVTIGYDSNQATFAFDGTIDEVALYTKMLTLAQVEEHYAVGVRGK